MARRRCLSLLPTLMLGLTASHAHAYCRTTTVDRQESSCPDECNDGLGIPLQWSRSEISVVLNARGFPNLDDATTRAAVRTAFNAWSAVACEDAPMAATVTLQERTTNLDVGPKDQEPNDNVVVHFTAEEWADRGLSSRAFALTALWYETRRGRILGADMHFNGGMDPFQVCPESGCDFGTDLLNVATHEAGHFLGLGHSNVADSTMWCDASPEEVIKRTLAQDDIDGICDIYGPGTVFVDDRSARPHVTGGFKGCAVSAPSHTDGAWLASLALPALALVRRRLRRRRA